MTRPLRVLLVSPLPPPIGGIARWTTMVVRALATDPAIRVRVIDTRLRGRDIQERRTRVRVTAGLRGAARVAATVAAALRPGVRPDVVHLNTSGSLGLVRDLAVAGLVRGSRVPLVVHVRFGRLPGLSTRSAEWRLFAALARLATTVVTIDRPTDAAVRQRCPVVRVELVPNFALSRQEHPGPRDQTLLFAGHVVTSKGVEDLLAAWGGMRHQGWSLVIAGAADPTYVAELRGRWPVADVVFAGDLPHEQLLSRLDTAGAFVLPSHTEGFPNTVVEAMMAGAPVVATRVGAVPEMLDEAAGLLVDAQDPAGLAQALQTLLDDPELRRRIGDAGRVRAEQRYSARAAVGRYDEIWRRAAGRLR